MLERLKAIDERYQELEKELADPEVYSNMNKMKSLSKEKRISKRSRNGRNCKRRIRILNK